MQTDARIADVLPTLTHDRENFIRGILGSFHLGKFDRKTAVVRIGVSGAGRQPHYSIEEGKGEGVVSVLGAATIRAFRRRSVFHGRSHKPILDEDGMGISWSSSSADYAEVQSVLSAFLASRKHH